MEKLRAAGLFGGGMVALTGSLARRYNECLELLGVGATKLKTFSIDGMGWSPEIALEKKNNFYLNNGPANVNAIIITPRQKDLAVHMPSHSFDKDVMKTIFSVYPTEIRDVTKDAALIAHLDQDIDSLFEPFDLLRYNQIEVKFKVLKDLYKKQQEQQALVALFRDKNNFINREIHKELLQTATTYGDLRKRKLNFEPILHEVGSFYTRAFGGVFILKEFIKPILVFEDEKVFKGAIQDTAHDVLIYHIRHDELMETLVKHLILEKNLKKAAKSTRYKRIKNHRFIQYLEKKEHSLKEILDSHFLSKKYLNQLDIETQKKIAGVEIYFQKFIVDKSLKIEDYVDEQYLKSLHQPHTSLEIEDRELVWKLLTKIMPNDPLHLYWYDKEQFYREYVNWDPDYREWVIECILKNN
ncbi:DUF6638 family protein [Muriicola sp. Z0-33]|uniref:DUF6638 family protein n=1 Tax=Muriicola sp. Z0-33 TaxID=2816957 RepID=UPI00223787A7|nr:DUF6638 family protein [Muriicola sp. Z0-33]MCW5516362.1 hypothetical protein [Muriicola sp. Z0-33]